MDKELQDFIIKSAIDIILRYENLYWGSFFITAEYYYYKFKYSVKKYTLQNYSVKKKYWQLFFPNL